MNTGAGHQCPLCGNRFDTGAVRCGGCPLGSGCGAVCCPRCGYEFADRSATVDAFVRIARGVRRALSSLTPSRGSTR